MEKCNTISAHILLKLKDDFLSPIANRKKSLSNQVSSTYYLQIILPKNFLKICANVTNVRYAGVKRKSKKFQQSFKEDRVLKNISIEIDHI